MPGAGVRTLVIVFALAVAGLSGCGGGGGGASSPERHATDRALADASAIGSLAAQAELERRSEALGAEQERYGASSSADLLFGRMPHLADTETSRADRLSGRLAHLDALGWRAFDEMFRKTPFDKAIDALAFRKAPLNVGQWVTDSPPDKLRTTAARERFYRLSDRARAAIVKNFYRSGPHTLYARVDPKRFYGMSVRARQAAVKAFYRDARPWFTKAGIKDFVLIVTPLTDTLEQLPAYAVGRGDSITLTPLGRAPDADGV